MIKAIIVEDEIKVAAALKKMLGLINSSINIVAEASHVTTAVELIKNHKPDLVFLDIELEDGTGFEVLEQLERLDFKLIFTTAYNQYAIDAFKYSAVDYILKPVDPEELKAAINRAINSINTEKEQNELIQTLKKNLKGEHSRIVVNTLEQHYIIDLQDLIRLEADGAYTKFITANFKVTASKNIKYYLTFLPTSFIRCHQSHLINSRFIEGVNKKTGLLLKNGDQIPISARKRNEIHNFLREL